MVYRFILSLFFCIFFDFQTSAQLVPIENYSVNGLGQVQLSIEGQADKYYILHAQHNPTFNWAVSMIMGVDGTMIITEPAGAYPIEQYSITAHDISAPDDYDNDGFDDVTEFNNMPTDAPFNFAEPIDFVDGTTSIPDAATFMDLATVNNVGWAPFLDDQLYVKFGILDRDTPEPKVYFINSNTYVIHASFWNGIGASVTGDDSSGEIVFNPNDILPNGTIGSYSFNFSFGNAYNFEATQRTYELLVANMPFLQNNMNHFIGQSDENNHINNYADEFDGSRIEVVLETDVFAEVNYIPFHEAEGYGFFKHMQDLNETPGSRDIVLYDALPNSLPRVGGIITSVIQTPLSHVNLRAIQDNVPNAYIANPLSNSDIASLLNGYIYYKVENDRYEIREASLDEVNAWYEDLRPTEPQTPVRDLSITEIIPLDDINFYMSDSFGAKCSNLATMRSFGFPDGTIPDGFGIPFYYYDEFMKFNNFYEEAQVMINNPTFQNDINFRTQRLKDFRRNIRNAPMPQWMMDDLQNMHDAFPEGTNVRCRSSTNNEDLPGFSGAGLYTSKTQYTDEGHISKSIKQVYASMWNFRAYEERDFYRIDHFVAAMGVLCHPNFQNEKSNGVGISIDPIYETQGTFYLNTQVGESLITNPDPNSVPEEILLYQNPNQGGGYLVLRLSNLVNPGELVMDQQYLDQMREFLTVIHDEFAILYEVVGAEGFGMDIEYKVTDQDQLIIKQARPWVSFWSEIKGDYDLGVKAIVEPQSSSSLGPNELVSTTITNYGLNEMSNFDLELLMDDQSMETITITQVIPPFEEADFQFTIPQDFSSVGDYNITVRLTHPQDEFGNNNSLTESISKVHELDGELLIEDIRAVCNNEVEVLAVIRNKGQNTITNMVVQVVVNQIVVDTIETQVNAPFESQDSFMISISDNLQSVDNTIVLNIMEINGQLDDNLLNNSVSTTTNLDSDFDIITLTINADNYPQETSWKLIDEGTNSIVADGALDFGTDVYTQDICVDYSSCFTLYVYDSYGDGICCGYGQGNIMINDSMGNPLVFNDGEFENMTQNVFCPDGTGCEILANINVTQASSANNNDATININITSGISPFLFSIDGGQTLVESNTFDNLSSGTYQIFIQGAAGCTYIETITVDACAFTSADIVATQANSVVSSDGSITITPTSGEGPYMYSINGGQSFESNNVFSNLAIGTYNIVVKDALEGCMYKTSVPVTVKAQVVINEINYSSSDSFDPGDWVELHNITSAAVDISNWRIRDANENNVFVFPENTQIEAFGYLIIVKDGLRFSTEFPSIPFMGELGFGLGSTDAVRLYDRFDNLSDEVFYNFEAPWPTCAFEAGHSLELINPNLDNLMAEHWDCINNNGSPNASNNNVPPPLPTDPSEELIVFPNPVSEVLFISGDMSNKYIEVSTVIGQRVLTSFGTNEIDVRLLSQGVYLISIMDLNGSVSYRFIKL